MSGRLVRSVLWYGFSHKAGRATIDHFPSEPRSSPCEVTSRFIKCRLDGNFHEIPTIEPSPDIVKTVSIACSVGTRYGADEVEEREERRGNSFAACRAIGQEDRYAGDKPNCERRRSGIIS